MAESLLSVLLQRYPDASTLSDPGTTHLVVEGTRVLSRHESAGVSLATRREGAVLVAELRVAPGARPEAPIHTCIGVLGASGEQRLRLAIDIGAGARAELLAHCLFPRARRVHHQMQAQVTVGEGAQLRYREGHYHGPDGGIQVLPRLWVRVARGGRYLADFALTSGRVGDLDLRQRVEVREEGVAELTARVFGHGTDRVSICDEMVLAGRGARGLLKTRVALEDDARATVVGTTRGQAEGARGHMDCMELVKDRAQARAEPIVDVSHPLAKVTHEAAVGTVDRAQLETLMAHGLSPEQAVDLIVTGLLS
jgi:hypothetical protein